MNINDIDFTDIGDQSQLNAYYPQIEALFAESFGKPLDKAMWQWAYIDNPFGSPLVSLACYKSKVVGHYAVIPLDLTQRKNQATVSSYLSMTTMVAADFRSLGLFRILANRVYDSIANKKQPSLVFGFPNQKSAPGFIKRLGWTLDTSTCIVTLKTDQLAELKSCLNNVCENDCLSLSLNTPAVRQWRANKPVQSWVFLERVGIKQFGDNCDIMYLENPDDLDALVSSQYDKVNILISEQTQGFSRLSVTEKMPYCFGYRAFNMRNKPEFVIQMAMSDVF